MKQQENITFKFGKMHLFVMVIGFPISIISLFIFSLIWSYERIQLGLENIISNFIYVFIGGVILHELLHGTTWAIFTAKGIKSIKFGFKIKYLTPYCHCKEALRVNHYKLGAAMPLILLGIVPSLYGIIVGNGTFFLYGLLFTYVAGGDIAILLMMRKLDKNFYISDCYDKIGFKILKSENN